MSVAWLCGAFTGSLLTLGGFIHVTQQSRPHLPRLFCGLPLHLTFFVTARCNAKCKHCFYWDSLNKGQTDHFFGGDRQGRLVDEARDVDRSPG